MAIMRESRGPRKDFQIFEGDWPPARVVYPAARNRLEARQDQTMTPKRYVRDMRGYGANPPDPRWPGGAFVAVQFVVNYEEGGENCVLHGDAASEAFLSEIVGAQPWPSLRHWNMESIYEYGARAGFWRLHRMFTEANVPVTSYGVATALSRSPDQVAAMQEAGWEIASHGLKWIDYREYGLEEERAHMAEAIRLHEEVTGQRPAGWYTGRTSANTVRLAAEEGFDYISDTYDDDLPYWLDHDGHGNPIPPQLIIPYTLDANDMRFATAQGFNTGDQFFAYLKDSFDTLYEEGRRGRPAMMSIGLHCRLVGRPGRAAALRRFIDYVKSHEHVWLARRVDIARHWREMHPYSAPALRPSRMDREEFVQKFARIFEHSPWVAERAFALELGPAHNSAGGVHNALCRAFRSASEDERLAVLKAHPDLAGKLAQAKRLTPESAKEQASAGLDALTDAERQRFTELNSAYVQKFGFPYIIAVKGRTKDEILAAFEARIANDRETEFETACKQVELIALLRLRDILPA
jgi:OHCU decarboxylase